MSALTCNGAAVLGGSIRMPRRGAWVADLTLDATAAIEGAVTIVTFDGRLSLTGTLRRTGVYADTARVLVVGGRGDLERELSSQAYRSVPARIPLGDILTAAGESLAASADAAVLGTQLTYWTRPEGPASIALASLLEEIGASWRVLPDGTVWVGTDAWPAAPDGQYTVLDEDVARGRMTLGIDAPWLLPAATFLERRVSLVVHRVEADGIRTDVWFEEPEAREPRLLEGLRALVRKAFARIDFLAPYRCRVIAQNSDGTLELRPDDARLPGLSRVPIRAGLPGVRVKVAPGARCYIEFDGGNPSRPIARGWEPDGMTELQFDGAAPIARQGDAVSTSLPPLFSLSATVTPSGPLTIPGTPVPCLLTVVAAPIPLTGVIITGSGKAKA